MNLHTVRVVVAMAILVLGATACTVGQGIMAPAREVPISVDAALEAQNLAANGMMSGSVEWSEAQFSSLLTELLKANSGEANPVESITAWFEPGIMYLRVDVKDGVLPDAVGDKLEVAGSLAIEDNRLAIDLQEAAAGPYQVEGAALAPISAQINAALAGQQLGVPVDVQLNEGTLSISLAQ
jgi:hypothetical protein